MNYLDAHCHLQDPRVDLVRKNWLERASAASITEFVLGGVGPEDWERQENLERENPGRFHLTAGLHPWWVSEHTEIEFKEAFLLLESKWEDAAFSSRDSKWVALGETGLDYLDRFSTEQKALQRYAFKAQLDLSRKRAVPLVLHVVRAHEDVLSMLDSGVGYQGGMVHSFSGSLPIAEAYLKKGFLLSLSAAVITRKSGKAFHSLREVVLKTKLSELLLETDAPDQPPADAEVDAHGRKPLNSVENLLRVAEVVAEWKGCAPTEVLTASTENWKRKFLRG